jgi:hypothetical protein
MTLEIAQDFQPAPLALFPERQCLAHGLFFVLDSAALDSPLNEFALSSPGPTTDWRLGAACISDPR